MRMLALAMALALVCGLVVALGAMALLSDVPWWVVLLGAAFYGAGCWCAYEDIRASARGKKND